MLAGEEPAKDVESLGLYLVPAGSEELVQATSTFTEFKNALKQHALGEGINHYQRPRDALAPRDVEGAPVEQLADVDADNARLVSVVVTNYRVAITFLSGCCTRVDIPMLSVAAAVRGRNGSGLYWVDIVTKNVWTYRIASEHEVRVSTLCRAIDMRIPRRPQDVFAYDHHAAKLRETTGRRSPQPAGAGPPGTPLAPTEVAAMASSDRASPAVGTPASVGTVESLASVIDPGWGIYNLDAELRRMCRGDGGARPVAHTTSSITAPVPPGVGDTDSSDAGPPAAAAAASSSYGVGKDLTPWFTTVELAADVFATYPSRIAVPRRATPQLLLDVAKFRQNGRIPALSWVNSATGSTLFRCSQPLVGTNRRSKADEEYCALINQSYHAAPDRASRLAVGKPGAASPSAGTTPVQTFTDPNIGSTSPATPALDIGASIDGPSPGTPLSPNKESRSTDPASQPKRAPSERRVLHIVDCRSRAAVTANIAAGGGHELTSGYTRATSQFLSLGNIHDVRKAFQSLRTLCCAVQRHCATWGDNRSSHAHFWQRLDATDWPHMTQKLLFGAVRVADIMETGDSALVHCTDGWDRTAQITSLAMIMSDPYYRTVRGFCILVEQEWVRLGFRFADRCDVAGVATLSAASAAGKGRAQQQHESDDDEDVGSAGAAAVRAGGSGIPVDAGIKPSASPVFIQFLDAVYQLLRTSPQSFEFTSHLLELLADGAYGGRFGTFLCNTHRTRHHANPQAPTRAPVCYTTASFWTEVARLVETERRVLRYGAGACSVRPIEPRERLLNPFWHGVTGADFGLDAVPEPLNKGARAPKRITPVAQSKGYRFWADWFLRGDFDNSVQSGIFDPYGPSQDDALVECHVAALSQLAQRVRDATTAAAGGNNSNTSITTAPPALSATDAVLQLFPDALSPDAFLAHNTISSAPAQQAMLAGSTAFPSVDDLAPTGEKVHDENYVIPREDSAACYVCAASFSLFSRRHTCRMCARSVCGNCGGRFISLTRQQIALKEDKASGGVKPLRVCDPCFNKQRTAAMAAPTSVASARQLAAADAAPGQGQVASTVQQSSGGGDAPMAGGPREAADTTPPPEPAKPPASHPPSLI